MAKNKAQQWLEESPVVEPDVHGDCVIEWPGANVVAALTNEQREKLVTDLILAGVPA